MRTSTSHEPVIVSTARTPFGRSFKGSLTEVRPDDLAAIAVQSALEAVPGLRESGYDELIIGCGDPRDEQGGNIARRVAVMLGADATSGITVNRLCASSVDATRIAIASVAAGHADAVVAAGVESISRYRDFTGLTVDAPDSYHPRFDDARRRSAALAEGALPWADPRDVGELPDVYIGMGHTAEIVAQICDVSRRDQDEYALLSQQRTRSAAERGILARQITPVTLPDGRVVDRDECPRPQTDAAALASLPTPFRDGGSVTPGNACGFADGASALTVMTRDAAQRLGAAPRARLIASTTAGVSPETMGLGPVAATRRLLERTGLDIDDFDVVELNEAFAAQVIASQRALGISIDRLNPNGGSIALGHPFGATGIRMIQSLLDGLDLVDGQLGLLTLCVGGGQGVAMAIERV